MLSKIWRVLSGLVVVCVMTRTGLGQSDTVVMMKAELVKGLDSSKVKIGDIFYLKLADSSQAQDCTLHSQTRLVGHITRLDRPGKGTELGVEFQAMPCAGNEQLMVTPLLVALGAKAPEAALGLQRLMGAGAEDAALNALFNPPPPASLGIKQQPVNKFETAAKYSFGGKGAEEEFRTGDVKGFRNLKMQLPQGTPETTLIARKGVYLDSGTIFMLTMVLAAPGHAPLEPRSVLTAEASDQAKPTQRSIPLRKLEPAEVCAAGGCVEAVQDDAGDSKTGHPVWSRSLDGMGFLPRRNRVSLTLQQGLDDDASVEFLGEEQVLVVFNTHKLVTRTAVEAAEGRRPRLARALVFSRTDGRLIKAENWEIESSSGPFLWSLADGRVLAHVGQELLELGAGLEVQHRMELAGPLLFLSTATGDGPMLVATVKERHQPGEHAKMAGFLQQGEAINEDYELTAIDASLQAIGSKSVSVVPLQPALLANAMVSARPDKTGLRYSVDEQHWTGERKRLAVLGSGCDVKVSTLNARTLFVVGCDETKGLRGWYRLMTPTGAILLKGRAGSTDFLQQALSDQDGRRFLLVSTTFNADTFASQHFVESDFKRLTVNVFDTKSGKEIFRVTPSGGSAMRQPVAISSSGQWVAVLTDTTLQVYGVGP